MFLKLFKTNANTVGGGQPVLTGPGFVDKANAATVEKLAAEGHAMTERPATGARAVRRGRVPVADERLAEHQPAAARSCGGRRSARCWPRSSSRSSSGRQNALFLQLDGIANWTDVASTIGIPAVVVALLMIGGEFDLSAGVMTGSAGLMMGILATEVGMNIWLAIVLTLIAATAIGFLNGYMVMRTKLPSFIVTLATFFILQGVNLGVTKAITEPGVGRRDRPRGGLRERQQALRRQLLGAARLPDHGAVVDRDHGRSATWVLHAHARRQLDLRRRRRRERRPQRRRAGRAA